MYRIRFHGRGGQGMKTAGRILGSAFFAEGFEVQDAPRYGAERRGAPLFAYVRASRAADPRARPDPPTGSRGGGGREPGAGRRSGRARRPRAAQRAADPQRRRRAKPGRSACASRARCWCCRPATTIARRRGFSARRARRPPRVWSASSRAPRSKAALREELAELGERRRGAQPRAGARCLGRSWRRTRVCVAEGGERLGRLPGRSGLGRASLRARQHLGARRPRRARPACRCAPASGARCDPSSTTTAVIAAPGSAARSARTVPSTSTLRAPRRSTTTTARAVSSAWRSVRRTRSAPCRSAKPPRATRRVRRAVSRRLLTGNAAAAWGARLAGIDYVPAFPDHAADRDHRDARPLDRRRASSTRASSPSSRSTRW